MFLTAVHFFGVMHLSSVTVSTTVGVSITTVLAVIATSLRLWPRWTEKETLRVHDYWAIAALVLTLAVYSNAMIQILGGGVGRHVYDLKESDPRLLILYLKLFTSSHILWSSSNVCVKFSALSLYPVLFHPIKKLWNYCRCLMGITVAYFIIVLVGSFLLCHPVEFNWYKTIQGGWCKNQNLLYLTTGIISLAIDALIVVLPLPVLFGLQIRPTKKFVIACVFSVRGLVCILSFMKVLWLVHWDVDDFTHELGLGTVYSVLEPSLGVVATCFPLLLKPLKMILRTRCCGYIKRAINTGKSSRTGIQYGNALSDTIRGGNGILVTREWEVIFSTIESRDGPTQDAKLGLGRTLEEQSA
ncbi:uncharacterized protein F4822DRAFT_273744 [Hypoxylon trugodes]|uniref:uncharacterized protein n=1 Tax=Hypoxylon trugodes TaxID=326681 RepID=UPI00218E8474|nr:uncharacterized protein F4822DRAFT_273744 [Hypoxylon trugodes]KAI1387104.1 hypothetical protein F4822DRAFT_273744 [Hypoxylon trugodes]